jgi:hypothetical protein
MVTFLGPLHKAERYFSAHHHLEQACLEFWGSDEDPRARKQKLMRRVSQARKMLQAADSDGLSSPLSAGDAARVSEEEAATRRSSAGRPRLRGSGSS